MTKLVQIYKDETILAEEDPAKRFMKVTWLKHPRSAQFREAALLIVQFVMERQIQYLLSDSRKVQYLDISDQNFLFQKVYATMPKDHALYISYILNQASYNLMDIYRIGEMVQADASLNMHLKTNIFLDEAAAHYWLLGSEA
ncbi:hypothetical protein TH61_16990 [Rufibacter sp. DG15C]|uniref:hypothetical protein n=1 Tax=Rufibacter sp. DG15C TaxID=1379909 RepID=UPI00078D4E89|nr:hypothetical protein [Rufibacter sp. DG15C]AMM52538.1 hypothetical protein TH61_16990 [Rufibacter sp. DG15C]